MRLHQAPLSEAARALRSDDISISAYVDDLRGRIGEVDPEVEAFVDEPGRWERVEEEATALEERFSDPEDRPALYGVPVGVKDIFHVDGMETRAGSELPPDALAGPQADAVTALRGAGALVLGKTHTAEFAHAAPGPTRNPHDLGHTPGGSSSGSAAAVAAGLCPLALGTQTGGSVIRPAAFCGVVGYKPTYGRVPIGGVIPLSTSLDHVGLFTQDVAGMRLAAAVLCEGWRTLPDPADRPTLGVPEGPYLDQTEAGGLRGFERALDALDSEGYEIRRMPAFEDAAGMYERHDAIMSAEAALVHQEWFEAHGDRYAESTAGLIREGREHSVEELAAARVEQGAFREAVADRMDEEGIDLWVCPPALGPAPEGIESTGDSTMNRPWTQAGMPVVTVPAGDAGGLPLGLQCVGRVSADERLLAWAGELADAVAGV